MSAIVCGKRWFFEDIEYAATSPTSASPPVYKKFRCSSATSPVRFSYSTPIHPNPIYQLRALFPNMETQLLEKALEEYGNDLDSAIKSLHKLRLVCAKCNSDSTAEENANMDNDMPVHCMVEAWPRGLIVGVYPALLGFYDLQHQLMGMQFLYGVSSPEQSACDGAEWVDLFVRKMMSATSIDDARSRAASILESLEKSISAQAIAEASQSFHKENMMLKEQIEALLRANIILKRALAIQHESQKEYDERNLEVQQLKQLVAQYQEQLRTLEVNNYALALHLRQAEQSNFIPERFQPDVF